MARAFMAKRRSRSTMIAADATSLNSCWDLLDQSKIWIGRV
jgi:hypothetical protein